MDTLKTPATLSLEYFKIQKEKAKLEEKQEAIKKEMLVMHKTKYFGKQDTLLGYVSVMVESETVYEDPAMQEAVSACELKLSHFNKKIADIKEEAKPTSEELEKLQKEGTKVQKEGGKVTLRFVPNK